MTFVSILISSELVAAALLAVVAAVFGMIKYQSDGDEERLAAERMMIMTRAPITLQLYLNASRKAIVLSKGLTNLGLVFVMFGLVCHVLVWSAGCRACCESAMWMIPSFTID
jgi:hypothetical protein